MPGWLVGMSIFATYVSSISYIGYPGKAFAGNWNAFVFSLSIPIASYFAAGMSTVATSITSSSTIILTDYVKPLRKRGNAAQDVRILQSSSLLVGILGAVVALAMLRVQSIIDAWWTLSSIFSGGMLGLFLLGYCVPRAGRLQALVGVIIGVLVIGWISLAKLLGLPGPHLHEYLAIVLGTMAIFAVGFFLTFLIKGRTKAD